MKPLGILMAVAGALVFAYAALLFDTSITSPVGTGMFGPSATEIVNLDLQQKQTLMATAGAILFLAGAIVGSAGAVIETIQPINTATPSYGQPTARESMPTSAEGQALAGEDRQELMQRYGIVKGPGYYTYGKYRYEHFNDAVAYARQQEHPKN